VHGDLREVVCDGRERERCVAHVRPVLHTSMLIRARVRAHHPFRVA
jgi:hypothetical protein